MDHGFSLSGFSSTNSSKMVLVAFQWLWICNLIDIFHCLAQKNCDRSKGKFKAKGGKLYVTNQRLIFLPKTYEQQNGLQFQGFVCCNTQPLRCCLKRSRCRIFPSDLSPMKSSISQSLAPRIYRVPWCPRRMIPATSRSVGKSRL